MENKVPTFPPKRISAATIVFVGATMPPCAPAMAAEPSSCAAVSSPRPAPRKDEGLGGLFGAVKRAGVGNLLGSGIIGEGDAARAAEPARHPKTNCGARHAGSRKRAVK